MKPRIWFVRDMCGWSGWICRGDKGDGEGPRFGCGATPQAAYQMWLDDVCPF